MARRGWLTRWLSTCMINSLSDLSNPYYRAGETFSCKVGFLPSGQSRCYSLVTKNASESRLGADLPVKPGTPSSSSPPASVQPSLHPPWPESHLKLWNCIPFSSPIDSGAVSKTNGGFRKSILMKEKAKEQGKERYLEKGGVEGERESHRR